MPVGAPILAKAVMYYPDCRGEVAWTGSTVLTLLFLGIDDHVARRAIP